MVFLNLILNTESTFKLRVEKESPEPAYYINSSCLAGFEPRENVSGPGKVLGRNFLETLFIQNFGIVGADLAEYWFLLCFCGGFSGLRNVLPGRFSLSEEDWKLRRLNCGGR